MIQDEMADDVEDSTQVRQMLDRRYDDIKTGRIQPIDGEEVFARLHQKSESRRTSRG